MSTNEHFHSMEEIESIVIANLKKAQKSNWWHHWDEKNHPSVCDTDTFLAHRDLYTVYKSPGIQHDPYKDCEETITINVLVNPMTHKLDIYRWISGQMICHVEGIKVVAEYNDTTLLIDNSSCDVAIGTAYWLAVSEMIRLERSDLTGRQIMEVVNYIQSASDGGANIGLTILHHYINLLFPTEAISDR